MKKFQLIYGHFPSFDELIEFDAVSPTIECGLYDIGSNVDERTNYLKRLSKNLINGFNISKNVTFTFEPKIATQNSYKCYISILDNTVKIVKEDETEIYEFDIDEILNTE